MESPRCGAGSFTVRAVKAIDPELCVGGPASAKNEWITESLEYCDSHGIAADFVSTHDYPTAAFVMKTILETIGLVDVFAENYYPSVPFHGGFGLLNLQVALDHMPSHPRSVTIVRIDDNDANPYRMWSEMGCPEYLSPAAVSTLEARALPSPRPVPCTIDGGSLHLEVELPPQAVAAIALE